MLGPATYILAFLVPLCHALGLVLGGGWSFFTLAFVFVFTPVMDHLLGRDERNPEGRWAWAYDVFLYVWVPVQLGLIAWTLSAVLSPATWLERVGWVVSLGVVSGAVGITVAHELMHRSRAWERGMAELLMTLMSYPHFCIEHVFGHHKHVATPKDPATARRGESVLAFIPRTLWGGFESFLAIEAERVRKHGRSGWSDARVRYGILLAAFYGVVVAAFGVAGAAVFFLQGLIAVLLLEVINYVEHYGLLRGEVGTDRSGKPRYERVRPEHSWNSSHWLTNAYLFHLPRHADHHANASRPFHALRHMPEGPQLPFGYATMVLVALVPPLWFRLMEPRLEGLERSRGHSAEA